MKKMVVKGVITLLTLTLAGRLFGSVGMNSYQVPENVGIYPDGKLEVIFPEVFNAACTSGEGRRMFVKVGNSQGVTEESFKYIKSIVLTAITSKTPIKFWYDRQGTVCEGGKVNIRP